MTSAPDLTPVSFPLDQGPSGMVVHGGVGSIRFQWEELGEGVRRINLLAEDLRDIVHQCGDRQWQLQLLLKSAPVVPGGSGPAAVTALDEARTALAMCDDELRDTAHRLETCRLTYAAAEAMAQLATAAVQGGAVIVENDLRRVIGVINAGGFAEPAALDLDPLATSVDLAIDGSAPALLQRVEEVSAQGPGIFEVLKVNGPEGEVYVVVLPGTQGTSAAASGNPFDPTGIVEALHYESVFVADAVHRALAESGAIPGDRVMVVGYSQGGMHAVNIAHNTRIAEDYQMELVLTAGSPTGREPSGGANYLHLEHADDWVHQVDGSPNPDERNRVTVTLTGPAVDILVGDKGLGPAHKLPTYLAGAEAAATSSHPSLLASMAALRAALGTQAPTKRHLFRVRRRREDQAVGRPRGGTSQEPVPGAGQRLP